LRGQLGAASRTGCGDSLGLSTLARLELRFGALLSRCEGGPPLFNDGRVQGNQSLGDLDRDIQARNDRGLVLRETPVPHGVRDQPDQAAGEFLDFGRQYRVALALVFIHGEDPWSCN
jgi:hypothetical protein